MTIFATMSISAAENEHAAARRLLYDLLRAYSRVDTSILTEARGKYGKPYFAEHGHIAFSLSHSGELAACAISVPNDIAKLPASPLHVDATVKFIDEELYADAVGCDIQLFDPTFDIRKIERIKERYGAMSLRSSSREDFFSSWVRAESLGKCCGIGLQRSIAPTASIIYEGSAIRSGKKYFTALAIGKQHTQPRRKVLGLIPPRSSHI